MRRLPPHHIRRPRLANQLTAANVTLIVAGGGYGKSALAAESCYALGVRSVNAVLEPTGVSAALLPIRLRAAAARAGLSDLVEQMRHAETDGPAGALDAMQAALARQPAVIVIDEVHHADENAVALLGRMAANLDEQHRLVLIGRDAPGGLDWLKHDPSTAFLGTADLALTPDEVALMCRNGFGLTITDADAAVLHATTAGWAAAVVLAASRAASTGDPIAVTRPVRGGLLDSLVDQILGSLSESDRAALVQLAHLPVIDPEVASAATRTPTLLTTAGRAGLPLNTNADGWSEFIGPVRELLVQRSKPDISVLQRAATSYVSRGRPGLAADVLVGADLPDAAASLIADVSPAEAEEIGADELASLLDRLPASAIDSNPRVLLHLARACEPTAATRRRAEALARGISSLGDPPRDPQLYRELQSEVARDLVRDDHPAEGEALAAQTLEGTGAGEELTRMRLLDVLGRAAARSKDDQHLAFAEDRMALSAREYRTHGHWTWFAQVMLPLGYWVYFARGSFDQAITCFDNALAMLGHRRRMRALILTFRAEVLSVIGRYEEAMANTDEAEQIGRSLDDMRILAYAAWERARAASLQGDAAATIGYVNAVESFRSDWFDQSGSTFLAVAADFVNRVGEYDRAATLLQRARDHPVPDEWEVAQAQAAIDARSGDPEAAEVELLSLVEQPWFEPRERWRIALLRAMAAHRRGDLAAASLAADAFDAAESLGYPALPFICERACAQSLVGLVPERRGELESIAVPVSVRILGGFEVLRGGRRSGLAPGQGQQLVKLLACRDGQLNVDVAVELLWPEVEPEIGANRLRTVLNRLRASAGALVERDAHTLRLPESTRVDAIDFEREARRALALSARGSREAISAARAALSRYRGDLLPDDPYVDWAVAPRERMRRCALSLLDLCAEQATVARDLDDALRSLARAIEMAPDEEERYLAAAELLLIQGRRGAARAMLRRARGALRDLGLDAPSTLLELERQAGV